tara:strand:+ start:2643 stop:2882 length:240 start_codon:yes stop_codon:yes gene_type:complete
MFNTYSQQAINERVKSRVDDQMMQYSEWKLLSFDWVIRSPFGDDAEWENTDIQVELKVTERDGKKSKKRMETWTLNIDI